MPPTLRSSSSATSSVLSTPNTTPRKSPQCSKCKRPRAGHPRQGCPFTDSPIERQRTESEPESQHITNALESMHIKSPKLNNKEQMSRRRSAPNKQPPPLAADASLASLSTNSSEIVARLLKPGIMADDVSDDEDERCRRSIADWQARVITPTKVKVEETQIIHLSATSTRSKMPGTLYTPSPSFFESTPEFIFKPDTPPSSQDQYPERPSPCRPLVRSASVEEREAFLIELSKASNARPATVYILPKSEISSIKKSAETIGFHSRVVIPDDPRTARDVDGDAWLILGRDLQAVQSLQKELEANKTSAAKKKGGSAVKAVAGGVVVGAVATWTGLAFS